jgi:hypothetical protein
MARSAAMDGPVDGAGWTITVVDACWDRTLPAGPFQQILLSAARVGRQPLN